MDPLEHQQRAMHHSISQPQIGPGQLPDESYIEKLFPKCQPKTSQVRGANQQFRNKRTLRAADRQQHYKRQNRAKQQQQQQPQQQNEAPRRNMTSRRPVKSTSDELIAFDKSRVPNSTTSHEIVSLTNSNHYCHSSDSTDKEKSVGRQNNAEPLKRSRSNQLMPQANAVAAAQYNKLRTRKYKASKNLQQQLKRSQSGYGKLFDSQPPPIDPSDRQTGPQKEKLQAAPQTDPANIGESAEGNRVNGVTTTKSNAKDDGTSRAADKGNRTNRGIVFAEPVAALLSAKAEAQPQQVSASTETKPLPLRSSNCIESESAPSVIEADGLAPAPGKSRQPAQVSAANKTAESKAPVRPQTESGEALLQVACAGIPNIHPSSCSSDEVRPLHFATDQTTSEQSCIESGICDTSANKVDNEDDDRFINLFVYDNASPQKRDEREVDKTTLITHKKHTETLATTSEQTLKATSQQLLGSDLSEDGLVSNDTSIEELCSFGDNDADDAGLKIRAQPRPTKRSSDHEFGGEAVNSDIAPATIGKSALKLHRSHSTLQTVDEKAEINIDDDDETLQDALEDARSKQADLSESTMIKKGLVPPGFVQRVRKPPVEVSATDSQISQSSPTRPAPISPPPNEQTRANPNAQSVDQLLPCLQPKEADEETRSVVERNLSEAMNKVSLDVDMPNLRQLKLPNEASHFSAVRSTLVDVQPTPRVEPQIDSRLQFNTLSDIESGADDDPNPHKAQSALKQQTELASMTRYASPGSSLMRAEEDSAPATRTALVFPCLDEGLSSEAESCDDEVDDDDDKAMEADVDADDDEDEDEDEDDEVEADNGPITKNLHSIQSSVDSFQQSLRPQNRLIGSLQQQATSGAQSRLPDLKSATTHAPHNDFTNSDALEQDDLKSNANYAARNGPANYWMGASQQAMSSQPSSSARLPHNNGNNANLTRTNSYPNRDDVKTANRLSSDTDNETDRLLGTQRNDQLQKIANSELVSNNAIEQQAANNFAPKQGTNSREVLIEGVLFNVKYLGSTHTECEGRGEKEERIHQAELAVHEVKFRNGEAHLPVEVQLFISTEKIMVLDDKHRKIMMDHSLRTISYIADIGDAIVLIVRKKSASLDSSNDLGRPISKTSCHVFESNESHTITKSISQAFQVAYTELLKANGGGDGNNYLPKELDYQEVLNSQEMSMTELEMFARKDNQREVIVPKKAGEILGLSIVESGWGSVLPTAVIASLKPEGPAYRCKKLSIGDQILSINGISLVGLSLKECQKILRKTKKQSVARLSVVPCPITVEVKIKRPDTKYQLGFSVQHGVICSLLRGGIAERGGVRVGHRIISINGTTVVGVAHDKIVTLLASSVGEIRMKTCLTSLYRHMLGEEKNVSFV